VAVNGEVSTRPVDLPADHQLLLSVYRSTRQPELELLGWAETELAAFVNFQFEAQSRHYAAYYPRAAHSVVLVDDRAAGRLIVEPSETVLIVDISLLPSFRGAGVGTAVIGRLIEEAERRGVPLTCHVEAANPALLFWRRLGFVPTGGEGAYIALARPAPGSNSRAEQLPG
jgi:GNAT superfamily N-acetyltransferase